MRKIFVSAIVLTTISSCTPGQERAVRTAFDVLTIGCILANAESDDAAVQKICSIADVLLPDLKKILSDQRTAARKYAAQQAAACKKDAGP